MVGLLANMNPSIGHFAVIIYFRLASNFEINESGRIEIILLKR